uniref:Uncharacterized protein n=1 Tax=Lactuca sativa TaxID=4236 RepID=A0A9R1XV35_LACSA|nr:hypothetical protein LSAT_V11C100016340 [Lactuca sativa]
MEIPLNVQGTILPDCVFSGNVQNLGDMLCTVTGFGSFFLQPNVGAAGEYAGLMVIRAYYMATGCHHRNVCIIPVSAVSTLNKSSKCCYEWNENHYFWNRC